jgi:hypothetical protein
MMFLNPWLLGGMAAIGAPIVIHMMMRRKARRMKWAAMRFVKVVVQRNERKLRLEDLLLLLLRCLLLILLAIALARPAFRAAGMAGGGGARTVVIALDNSYSMGLTDGGTSRIDNARKAATAIVDALPAGSSVALLFFSNVSRPAIAEPAADLTLVKRMIAGAELTDRSTDVEPALDAALAILKRHAAERGEVYLVTDGQATAWREMGAMQNAVTNAAVPVTIVEVGPGEQPNLGVSDLKLASGLAPVGSAVRFSIQATNYGRNEARNVTVGLSIDGEHPSDQAVIESIPAGQSRSVSLFGKLKTDGFHTVSVELPPDHLAADDRRTIVVRAVTEVRVLLVAGAMGAMPREGDAFFLDRALAPVPVQDRAQYYIKPRVVTVEELSGVKLEDFGAVALVDVPQLDAGIVAELTRYVHDGGGLMIFPGEKMDAGFYNQAFGGDMGMLPAAVGAVWGDVSGAKYRTLQAEKYTHPMVSIWQDPAAGTLSTARFYKGVTLERLAKTGKDAGEAVTILKYEGGAPAIMERTWGAGRVIEFSSTGNAAWNDLPAHPAFVPLMQRALGRLVTRRDEALNIPVGGVFTYQAPAEWLYKDVTITRPTSGPGNVDKRKVALVNGEPLLQYDATDWAGAYDVEVGVEPVRRMKFATQAEPEESKLVAATDEELESLGAGTRVIHWTPATTMREAVGGAENGREFWSVFAALALAVACCETFLGGRFSTSK